MCMRFRRRGRPRDSDANQKSPLLAIRRVIATSTAIATVKRQNTILVDGTDDEKAEFSVWTSEKIQKHLRNVYEEAAKPDKLLSKDRFASFLKDTQRCDEELAARPLVQEVYNFHDFLGVWYKYYGWRAMKKPAPKDLSKPITQYYISSSHNTYLEGNQLSSHSTAEAYRNVLKRDCRCIEIDVWNGEAASRTPSRSRSPHPGHHGRHLSAASAAASALELVEDTYESVVDRLSGNHPHHHRASSSNLPTPIALASTQESSITLDPNRANETFRPRASSRTSRQSARSGEEPIVMHGFTLTRPVGFREVCKAIREEAFKTNDLPIIVSLQVGATKEQQEVMVDIMKEEWEGLLLDKPHETCDPRHRQPRLDELLRKILVKVKRAPEKDDSTVNPTHLSPHPTHETSTASQEEEERLVATGAQKKKGKIEPICDNLSQLAVYTHSEHFDSLDSPGARLPSHIFSLSEKQIERLHATRRNDLHRHNSNFFMRAYPNPIRIDSSNPDPSFFWRRGVQMVAMNWQNLDEGMMVNGGMFAGEKGWVLKTEAYRNENATPLSPTSPVTSGSANQHLVKPQRTLDLRITVFAGQQVPLPPTQEKPHQGQTAVGGARSRHYKPYVKCALHVEKADKGDKVEGGKAKGAENGHAGSTTGHSSTARDVPYKQQTKAGDTDHPDFGPNGQILEFNNIRGVIEELSFVRFKIQDSSSSEIAAWACIRLDRLRHGYRFIKLLSPTGTDTEGQLFVRIDKTMR